MLPKNPMALVADDHELFSNALKALLHSRLEFSRVELAATFDEVMTILAQHSDVTLLALDLDMPGMAGGPSIGALRNAFPQLRTVMVSASANREQVLKALSWGVHGYVPKTMATTGFVQAFRLVMEGQIYVPPTLLHVTDEHAEPNFQPRWNEISSRTRSEARTENLERALEGFTAEVRLSTRQRMVLDLLAKGQSNKQIARTLGLAEGTVKVHINSLYRALHVHNRAGAVATRLMAPETAMHAPGATVIS